MFHAQIAGTLTADPVERTTAAGRIYMTASVRVPIEREDAQFVGIAAFDDEPIAALRELCKGDAVSITGPAKLRIWAGSDGKERAGNSVLAQRVLGGKPQPRRRAPRQQPQQSEQNTFPAEAGDLSIIGGKK
jgi:single-stranded DNA-binding protein